MTTRALPQMPADISLFMEGGQYVFRLETQSIYVFDGDEHGLPTCTHECANLWRAVIASADAREVGDWSLVERSDGTRQWRYKNRPLYTYAKDGPGETLGDGVDGKWHLVTP